MCGVLNECDAQVFIECLSKHNVSMSVKNYASTSLFWCLVLPC